jgi:hypothetical protein
MRVVMTGADSFLGWHTRGIALAICSERAVNYLVSTYPRRAAWARLRGAWLP